MTTSDLSIHRSSFTILVENDFGRVCEARAHVRELAGKRAKSGRLFADPEAIIETIDTAALKAGARGICNERNGCGRYGALDGGGCEGGNGRGEGSED